MISLQFESLFLMLLDGVAAVQVCCYFTLSQINFSLHNSFLNVKFLIWVSNMVTTTTTTMTTWKFEFHIHIIVRKAFYPNWIQTFLKSLKGEKIKKKKRNGKNWINIFCWFIQLKFNRDFHQYLTALM